MLFFSSEDLGAGEVLSSVSTPTVSPVGLTLGGFTHDSDRTVEVSCSGGTDGILYVISFDVTTSVSQILEGEVAVLVKA